MDALDPTIDVELSILDSPDHVEASLAASLRQKSARSSKGGREEVDALKWKEVLRESAGVMWLVTRGLASLWPPPPAPEKQKRKKDQSQGIPPRRAIPPRPVAISRPMSEIKSEPVDWLWPGRIPRRRVSAIVARQGTGKSTFLSWLCAAITSGLPWPDNGEINDPGSIVLLQAEEIEGEDIRPRLDAMGADSSKVHVYEGTKLGDVETTVDLMRDMVAISDLIDQIGDVRMVMIDPIGSYVKGINAHTDTEVRMFLQYLVNLARQKNVAVVLVMHTSKDMSKDILDRVGNAAAFTQVPRMVWYLSDDPKDKSRRILSFLKGNPRDAIRTGLSVGLRRNKLIFRPDPIHLCAHDIDHLLQKQALDAKTSGKIVHDSSNVPKAKDFIVKFLEKGPAWVSIVLDQAEAVHIKESTFRKALRRLVEDDGRVKDFDGDDKRKWIKLVEADPDQAKLPFSDAPEASPISDSESVLPNSGPNPD